MDGDRRIGRGGSDEVICLLVPHHGVEGAVAMAITGGGGLVDLPKLH